MDIGEDVNDSSTVSDTQNIGSWLMWILFLGGIILVSCSYQLGRICVQDCSYPNGNCGWNPEEVDRAAQILRALGSMAFAAGLAERLIFALTKTRT